MSLRALGAVTASAPLEALLPFIGWRGAFWAVAALSVSSAALIFFSMPDRDDGHGSETCRRPARRAGGAGGAGSSGVFGAVGFLHRRLHGAPGPVAVPWLMEVNGYSRALAADHLFWLNIGHAGRPAVHQGRATPLARRLATPLHMMQVGLFLSMVVLG